MSPDARPDPHCIPYLLRIAREQIGFLRFLLEGYEGLAQLEGTNRRGEVTLWVPVSRRAELERFLGALAQEIDVEVLESQAL